MNLNIVSFMVLKKLIYHNLFSNEQIRNIIKNGIAYKNFEIDLSQYKFEDEKIIKIMIINMMFF